MTAALQPREDAELPGRFARSAAATSVGACLSTAEFHEWFSGRGEANRFRVERIPLTLLDRWYIEPETGNLRHRSGKFFSVEGLHVAVASDGPFPEWQQPTIVQPEVGILGILAKEFDGVLHFLMQAKMEPGNPNLLQLSPTVQATRSNYTRVHQGAEVKYLDYFTQRKRVRVLVDVLQSEHGAWFFRKSNRNMIVETAEDVPLDDDFRWLTLGQIGELLRHDNLVNMDSRTVIACAPVAEPEQSALISDTELLSWFTAERSRHDVRAQRIALASVDDWVHGEYGIENVHGRYFRVMAVAVHAGSREVTRWTQPMFEPLRGGTAAFLVRRFHGVAHLLVQARVEGGFLDTVELGPTVQFTAANYRHVLADRRPPFLDAVQNISPDRIRYEAVHSEEGGRFFHGETHNLVIDADEDLAPARPPVGFRWVTPSQLSTLVRHGRYVNVQARTLLSLINSGAVAL